MFASFGRSELDWSHGETRGRALESFRIALAFCRFLLHICGFVPTVGARLMVRKHTRYNGHKDTGWLDVFLLEFQKERGPCLAWNQASLP